MTSTGRGPEAGATPEQRPTVAAPREGTPGPGERAGGGSVQRMVARMSRPHRVVPAVIVATILAVVSIVVAAEVISRVFDRPWNLLPVDDLARWGRETPWNDPLALTVAGVTLAVGLLLLLMAIWPGRTRAMAVESRRDGVVMAVTTAALARIAEEASETVDGVSRARASAKPRHIRVRADSALRETGNLGDQVHDAVTAAVAQLEPLRPPQVRVTVRRREEAS